MSLLTLSALCMDAFRPLSKGRAQHSINLMVPMNCPCSVQHGRVLLQKCQVGSSSEKYFFPLCHIRSNEQHNCPFMTEKIGVQILVSELTCCVILGELFKHAVPQFFSPG